MSRKYGMPPGKGERIAIGGYKPQYLTAVFLTLGHLLDGSLRELHLADLEAGRVDDLLIFTKSDVLIAFQMKTQEGELTYADFAAQAGDRGLMADLADGWQRLRKAYPHYRLLIRFLTSQSPSNSTSPNVYLLGDNPEPRSFADFLDQCWLPFKQSLTQHTPFAVPVQWQQALDHWRNTSGLSQEEFGEFAEALDLHFRYLFPDIGEIDKYASFDDSTGLYYHFQSLVAGAKGSSEPIMMSEEDIKAYLGKARFETRNIHSFRVADWYRPIAASVQELTTVIDRIEGGYVALLGSPGSGKSSLLTRTLVESPRQERIIRYYAYVPDEPYGSPPRGEAVNFLHDVTLQLEQCGFKAGDHLPESDTDFLRKRLGLQLQCLADDYAKSRRKTLILIDGLDHIAREQSGQITETLLAELPSPDQILPGIIFILGSQHLVGLKDDIVAQLQSGRTISVQPLSLQETSGILTSSGIWNALQRDSSKGYRDASGSILRAVYQVTQGHPLALAYLIEQLRSAARKGEQLAACRRGQSEGVLTGKAESVFAKAHHGIR